MCASRVGSRRSSMVAGAWWAFFPCFGADAFTSPGFGSGSGLMMRLWTAPCRQPIRDGVVRGRNR